MTIKIKRRKSNVKRDASKPYKNLPEVKYSTGDLECPSCGKQHKHNCPVCGGPGSPWLI